MRSLMRTTTLLASLALVASGVTSAATGARAADVVQPPQVFAAEGANYGVAVYWWPSEDPWASSYTVTLYAASDSTFSTPLAQQVEGTGSPSTDYGGYGAEFFDLTPGNTYRVTVVANAIEGGSSAPTVTDVMQAYAPIAQVKNLSVAPRNKKLLVTWKPPVATALTGPLTGYRVTATTFGRGYEEWPPDLVWVPKTAKSVTLDGLGRPLENGVRYDIEVVPFAGDEQRFWPQNQFRRGFPRAASVVTRPLGPPPKPGKLKYAWKSKGKTKLTWKKSRSTYAAPVTGYNVYVNGKRVKTIRNKNATTWTVTKQKKGKRYTFKVAAFNSAGGGAKASTGRHKRP